MHIIGGCFVLSHIEISKSGILELNSLHTILEVESRKLPHPNLRAKMRYLLQVDQGVTP